MFIENYYKLLYSPLFIKIYSNALLPLQKQFLIIANRTTRFMALRTYCRTFCFNQIRRTLISIQSFISFHLFSNHWIARIQGHNTVLVSCFGNSMPIGNSI